jgi:hypothetical protein
LLARLKANKAPVHHLGIQSHIGPGTNPESQGPNTFGAADQAAWKQFLDAAVAMGLRLCLTEFDVSERGTPSDIAQRDRFMADLTKRYLDFMFAYRQTDYLMAWGMLDNYSWLQQFGGKRPDGMIKRPSLYDGNYQPSPCARLSRRRSETPHPAPEERVDAPFPGRRLLLLLAAPARAEDGYDLWLRYRPVEAAAQAQYRPMATAVVSEGNSPSLEAARRELTQGLSGLLAKPVGAGSVSSGALVIGTPVGSPLIATLKLPLGKLGPEGYLIRSTALNGHAVTVIAANSDIGVLYGSFAFLRLIQTRQSIDRLDISSAPRMKLRLLNHWDNLDGTIERGYAGIPSSIGIRCRTISDPRYTVMARANASVGINGISVNNVSADVWMLSSMYLGQMAALANVLRPYGIRVYVAAKFSAPVELGKLKTADPADPQVQAWWKKEGTPSIAAFPISAALWSRPIPKASPGPRDYDRTQAKAPM